MDAHIVGVAQELSFEEGATVNYMVVQLPNGHKVRAIIDSAAAITITNLFVTTGGAAAQRALDELSDEEQPEVQPPPTPQPQPTGKPHPALKNLGSNGHERAAAGKSYTPLTLDDDGNSEFGGNYVPGMDEESDEEEDTGQGDSALRLVENELVAAASAVAGALGMDPSVMDAAALRRAVASLQLDKAVAPATLPQPSWDAVEAQLAQPTVTRVPTGTRQVLTIQADAKGNPVFHGSNVVSVEDLTGGNTDGEEPGEVGSI